ncbi:DUF3693 domain-containing protein [Paraburkholderia sediminicola]|uniref:DUF3693 domain-containing protein n=1 Tax=Paraburkholderia sediminicola TaxID=458836 RepID=UPI0038BCD727
MKTTIQYLDAVKKKLDLPSDYAAAKALGVTRAAVSRYRNSLGTFDEAVAMRAAEILNVDPLEVISACKAESAHDERIRKVWVNIWGKATGAATTVAVTVFIAGLAAAPSPARSAPVSAESATLYLMSN